jgi:hypothetical protein
MDNKALLLVYLSGKVTGVPGNNILKFRAAERLIRETLGCTSMQVWVCVPHDLPDDHDKSWPSYMRECLKALATCTVMYVLDDWKQSRGALVEMFIAKVLNIPVYQVETFTKLKISYTQILMRLLCRI